MDAVDHDHQLRSLLKMHLGQRVTSSDLVVDEFQLPYGAVRADVALVNGHLEGFEIKAGRDTLSRLPHQIEAYDKVFEYSWIVTTQAHLPAVRALVPRNWGLLVGQVDLVGCTLRQVRSAKKNPRRDADHLARLLWREELMSKLEALGLARGLKSKPKLVLFATLASVLPVGALADYVRHCLKTRVGWRVGAAPHECDDSSHHDASETHCLGQP